MDELHRWERCRDCGRKRDDERHARQDVCQECLDLRVKVLRAVENKKVSIDDFKKYQKKLRGRSFAGRAFGLQLIKN